MEHFVWCGMALAVMVGGGRMALLPGDAVVMNRDDAKDASPPSAGEVWQMRVVGMILVEAGAYFLYLILSGAPGAADPTLI